jgi:hypothetical protein
MRWQDQHSADDFDLTNRTRDWRTRRCLLEDAFLESYVRWREACADVRLAYQHWESSSRHDARDAFAVYHAALDQEECAAHVYGELAGRLSPADW